MMTNSLVLVVDDDPASRETLADLLSIEPHEIAMASDGVTMFAYLEQSIPDVILLDVMMPNMNGFEICKRIKSSKQWSHIPVVLITALNDYKSMITGLDAGADEFLSKPISGPELRARVRNMVRLKQQYDALQASRKLQEDMFRIAVHDMRQPLSTIYLQISTLLFKLQQESDKKSLDVINVEARHLDNFIDDLLILLKKDKGNLSLTYSPVNIKTLIQESIMENTPLASAIKVEIFSYLTLQDKKVMLDRNLFRRVVDNLLSNALRRSTLGGKIKVYLQQIEPVEDILTGQGSGQEPLGIRIMVTDEGASVLPEIREKIFEMDEIIDLKKQGISASGIGLAFCKMVVTEHSGKISMTDNKPTGCTIIVEL
jgi:DNA-binding response OmpR family regulator